MLVLTFLGISHSHPSTRWVNCVKGFSQHPRSVVRRHLSAYTLITKTFQYAVPWNGDFAYVLQAGTLKQKDCFVYSGWGESKH